MIRGDGNRFFNFGHRFLVHGFFDIRHAANVVSRNVIWVQLEYFGCLLYRFVVSSCQEKFKTLTRHCN